MGLEDWLWAFKFTDAYCNTGSDGVVPDGLHYKNLARGGGDAIMRNSGGTLIQAAGRAGIVFPAAPQSTANFIELGGAPVDFSAANDNFLVIAWDKQPSAGYNTDTYRPILWDAATNANNAALWIDSGVDGKTIRAVFGTGASSVGAAAVSGLGQGAPRQIAVTRIGTQGSLYINGVQRAVINSVPTTLQSATAAVTKLAANHTGTIYQTLGMRIHGTEPRSPQQIIAADYAIHAAEFA